MNNCSFPLVHIYACKPTKCHLLDNWPRIRARCIVEPVEIMHNAGICGDYVARGYYASIFSDCLRIISLFSSMVAVKLISSFSPSPTLHFILFSLSTQFPSVVLHPLLLSFSLSSSPPPPLLPSFLPSPHFSLGPLAVSPQVMFSWPDDACRSLVSS